ncbi:MAG: TIGR03960 family B12-binding radical SAM protein [Firmicutes bacterium]|nr:TIGR03960 family B12-binding radical SAM protein [Bacillota bacterium]
METAARVDALLDSVQRPARYIGGEMNAAAKPWEAAAVRFALCFPDTYEVGMSHLGMKILYEIVNSRPDTLCERIFAPWVDMADLMRGRGVPLFSLESRRPARDFDVVGFTLQYELCYTSVLAMLDLAGIPLETKDRGNGDPIVIAGGPCAFNPEPLHAFIDAFCLGDGEELIGEVLDAVRAAKAAGEDRLACLSRLAAVEGVYIPAFYEATYQTDGRLDSFEPKRAEAKAILRKRVVANLDAAPFPQRFIVPFQEIVHDRIMLEIMRGCTRGCRFCQAGMLYRPVRERGVDTLLSLAEKLLASTGYEEMSLSSLSTGDYTRLEALVRRLSDRFENSRVSLSLPSLRLDKDLHESLALAQKVRKGSLTFAPEAGTQRLRDVINKGVSEEDLLRTARDAFAAGNGAVKLYFMIGLPTETDEDIDGIVRSARLVSDEYFKIPKGERPRGLRVSVSVSSFVPKPFTPFQWAAQDTMERLREKQNRLRAGLKAVKGAAFHWHDPQASFLEACFSRGDRRLSGVLLEAWRRGCRFDGWSEQFRFDTWMEAFAACGLDPAFYANRERAGEELLPWAFIGAGVTQAYLWEERARSLAAEVTKDCRESCNGCGLMEVCFPCA